MALPEQNDNMNKIFEIVSSIPRTFHRESQPCGACKNNAGEPQLSTSTTTTLPTHLRTKSLHRQLNSSERPRTNRRRPQQRRSHTPPEPTQPLLPERLRKSIPHALIPLLLPEPIRLHLRLDDIQRVRTQPQRLASQRTVAGNLPRRDLAARNVVARRVRVHQVLERQEPAAVGLRFAHQGDRGAAVEAFGYAGGFGQFGDAV